MRLYIIRHGETDWNAARRFQGRADIPLNEEGRRLARITSEALREVPFARIFTSPLKRAYETAVIMKGARDIPVIEEPRIIEIGFGEYEGMCAGKENYNIPDPDFLNFFDRPEAYKPPGGAESIEQLRRRTADFLQETVHNNAMADDTILVSTHGAALRGLLSYVEDLGIGDFWKGGVHKNCAVTIVEAAEGQMRIIEQGKTYYIDGRKDLPPA